MIKTLPSEGVRERRFSPYVDNGGIVVGLAGKGYAIVAGDTRMSFGYSIGSRKVTKLVKLTDNCVLGSAGMQAERATLHKVLQARCTTFRHEHNKNISAPSMAQLLSNTLYYKRFFPYYTFNVLAGLDTEGNGAIWGYDAIGSFQRLPYCVTGSGSALGTSILDNQVLFKTQPKNKKDLNLEEALDLVKDVMASIGERDIHTGDSAEIAIITKDGVKYETIPLQRD